ncbi:MAG: hypothetical protein ACRDA5_16285 [Clostridium sp.]
MTCETEELKRIWSKEIEVENTRLKELVEKHYDRYINIKENINVFYKQYEELELENMKNYALVVEYGEKICKIESQIERKNKGLKKNNKILQEKNSDIALECIRDREILDGKYKLLESEHNDAQTQIAEYKKKITILENKLSKLEITNNKIEDENVKLQEENRKSIIKFKKEINTVENKNRLLKLENQKVQNEKILCVEKMLKLEGHIENMELDNESLKNKNDILRERLDALRNSKLGKINMAYWKFKNRHKEGVYDEC